MKYDIVFHPSWWNKNAGIDFSESFWFDENARIPFDVHMRRILFEKFGEFGLGEKNPMPRPILGSDMLACGFLTSMILGCKILFAPDNAPQVLCANLSEDAAFALESPDLDNNPTWLRIQSQCDRMKEKYGYVDCCMDFNGIQNLALDLRGQNLFFDYYDEDSPAKHLLDVSYITTRNVCRKLKFLSPSISAGVSNIVRRIYPECVLHSNCSVEMISEQMYSQWLLPYEIALAEEFADYGIHHCGQSCEHVIKAYAKTPNLKFVEIGAFSDLGKCVAALNENVLINARYSPARLAVVSDVILRQEITEMAKIVPGKRLSISCVGIDSSCNDERVSQFLSYCKEILKED